MHLPPRRNPSDAAPAPEGGPTPEEEAEIAELSKLATAAPAHFQALMLQGILRQATALEDIAETLESILRMLPEPKK